MTTSGTRNSAPPAPATSYPTSRRPSRSSSTGAIAWPAGSLLLDRHDVDGSDVRVGGQQVGRDLPEGLRDLPVQVGLTGVLGLEGVEDAVAGVADLERVPGNRALLGDREVAARLQERGEFAASAGLGLQLGENA